MSRLLDYKLDMDGRARASELEGVDAERLAWHAACLESELRCPDCGCATPLDAEASECGCDAPVCAADCSQTLAEAYAERDEGYWRIYNGALAAMNHADGTAQGATRVREILSAALRLEARTLEPERSPDADA